LGDKILKAGVIGLGVGERHIEGYLASKNCEVHKFCDKNLSKLKEVQKKYPNISATTDPNDVLFDPTIDVVSIASYDEDHFEQVLKGISSDKHLFVEKPLCLSRGQLAKIHQSIQKKPHLKIGSNLILRCTPRFKELRRNIETNQLGRIYYVEGDYDYGRIEKITSGWRSKANGYSIVLGGAIHLIDLILWLHRTPVSEVTAVGSRICTEGTDFAGYDMMVANLLFVDGSIGRISANFGSVTKHHHRLSVYGTEGTFSQGHQGAMYQFGRDKSPKEKILDQGYPAVGKDELLKNFVLELQGLCDEQISNGEIFETMNVALAIEEALQCGKAVKVATKAMGA
jgi:predicted dehydrogenase